MVTVTRRVSSVVVAIVSDDTEIAVVLSIINATLRHAVGQRLVLRSTVITPPVVSVVITIIVLTRHLGAIVKVTTAPTTMAVKVVSVAVPALQDIRQRLLVVR